MEVIRSLPNWRTHVLRAVVDVKKNPHVLRKRGPRVQNTRLKKERMREKTAFDRQVEERRELAMEELRYSPTTELEDAVFHLETGSRMINTNIVGLILQECGHEKALATGVRVHKHISGLGYDQEVFLGNHLIQMYGKCGRDDLAYKVFSRIRHRDTHSWTAMMNAYVAKGYVESAKRVFTVTPKENFVSWNTMIAAYAQYGQMESAEHLFEWMVKKTVVTWTTMVRAYTAIRQYKKAVWIFKMMDLEGFEADKVAVSRVLAACSWLGDLTEGQAVVSSAAAAVDTFLLRGTIQGNAVINMYSKCGSLEKALSFFHRIPEKELLLWSSLLEAFARGGYIDEAKAMFDEVKQHDVCSWSAMIIGYCQCGEPGLALKLLPEMDLDGVGFPDWECWLSIIEACGDAGDYRLGKEVIHQEIVAQGLQTRLDIANAMLEMYLKMDENRLVVRLFARMKRHSVISWGIFVAANSRQSSCKGVKAIVCMLQLGVRPDAACARHLLGGFAGEGLVEEGVRFFRFMEEDFGVKPGMEHFVGMIELFGHHGEVDLADEIAESMPFEPGVEAWSSLLSACQMYGDSLRAEHVQWRAGTFERSAYSSPTFSIFLQDF